MRRLTAALVGGGMAILLFLGTTPSTDVEVPTLVPHVPLAWRSPVRWVEPMPSEVETEVHEEPPPPAPASAPPWRALLPSAQAFLHVEDGDGYPVDDVWVSWVCVSNSDRGPEIRVPVEDGERIRGLGDCLFQAVDSNGSALSDDLEVSLQRGDVTDVWLVID